MILFNKDTCFITKSNINFLGLVSSNYNSKHQFDKNFDIFLIIFLYNSANNFKYLAGFYKFQN